MKIGVLTFHNSFNFGANLQTLATQSILTKAGIDATVLDYQDPVKIAALKQTASQEQALEHKKFERKYYNLSPVLTNNNEIQQYCLDSLDGVLVGSDAVFRIAPKYQPRKIFKKLLGRDRVWSAFTSENEISAYWLDWEKGKKNNFIKGSIAASSRGTSFYFLKMDMYKRLWKSTNDFNFISTRDDWTRLMVKCLSLGKQNPVICPDPVFGLNNSFDIPEDEHPDIDVSKTILLSGNFNREWLVKFKQEAGNRGYKIGTLPNPESSFEVEEADICVPLPLSPLQWYKLLDNCAGFVGMRFHALVSCIANKTPVFTVDVSKSMFRNHDPRNPNFDLCKRAGIRSRYILQQDINMREPKDIIETLFDKKTMRNANAYADRAPVELDNLVGRLLD